MRARGEGRAASCGRAVNAGDPEIIRPAGVSADVERGRPVATEGLLGDYAVILAALPCGALWCDTRGAISWINDAAARLLGRDCGDLLGRRLQDAEVWPPVVLGADERPLETGRLAAEMVTLACGTSWEKTIGVVGRLDAAPMWVTLGARRMRARPEGTDGVVCLFVETPSDHGSTRHLWARASRLRSLLDCVPDTYFVLDGADRIAEWYGGAAPFLAGRRRRLMGAPLPELLPPECSETAAAAFAEVRSGLPISSFDLSWDDADDLRFGEAVCRLLPDGMLAVIVRDVTDRWRAEEELLTIEEHYRLLAENARDIISRVRCRPVPRVEYVSPSVERLLGYAPEAFYRDDTLVFRLLRPDKLPELRAVLAGEWDFDQPWEICFRDRDGDAVWVEQQMTATLDHTGRPITIDGVARDVTERRRQAERLRERDALLRVLAEPEHDVVWQLRVWPELRYEHISRSVSRLLGWSAEELLADPATIESLLTPESREKAATVARGEWPPDEPQLLEWTARDGRTVFTESRITTIRDEVGRVVIVQGVARDITRRVAAEGGPSPG